jgi:hypothetical protein
MKYGYHSSELISIAQSAQSLGASMKQINTWIKEGRFPPPVTVDGLPLHSSPVVPLDELNYVAALMAAEKPWSYIEREVQRLVNSRARRPASTQPTHLIQEGEE